MTGRIFLTAAAVAMSVGVSAAAPHAAKKKPAAPAAAPSEAEQLVRNCNAHKFETVVRDTVDGQPHQSKVTLCGKEGQSDAEWIGTLKDAIAKVTAKTEMPATAREQIVTALSAEVARLEKPVPLLPSRTDGKTSAVDALAALPPLTLPKANDAPALPAPRQMAQAGPADEYAALPPLPAAPPPPPRVLVGAGSTVAALPMPRMSFVCFDSGQAEGPCTAFTRETVLTVRAGEDVPAGTSLRFVRDGQARAEVALAQLRKGRSMQLSLPADVCRHVVGGRLEIRVVRAGQEVGTEGPFNLNC